MSGKGKGEGGKGKGEWVEVLEGLEAMVTLGGEGMVEEERRRS